MTVLRNQEPETKVGHDPVSLPIYEKLHYLNLTNEVGTYVFCIAAEKLLGLGMKIKEIHKRSLPNMFSVIDCVLSTK